MNILITGGTGFIGSHLLHSLVNTDNKIYCLTRKGSDTWRINDILQSINILPVDQNSSFDRLFDKYQFNGIIHLAGSYKKYNTTSKDIKLLTESNITFPSLLLLSAVKHNVSFFINTGTCFEYQMIKKPLKETATIFPLNYYAATKAAFEQILSYYCAHTNLKGLTLRLFYPYGEKDNQKIITMLVKSVYSKNIVSLTKGEQELNYTYIGDIIQAFVKALLYIKKQKKQYDVINVGSEKTYKLVDIVSKIKSLTKDRLQQFHIGDRPYTDNEIMYINANCTKAKLLLHWKPKISMEQGLKQMIHYYKHHPTECKI